MKIRLLLLTLFLLSLSFSQNATLNASLVTVQYQNPTNFTTAAYELQNAQYNQSQYTNPSQFETAQYSFTSGSFSDSQYTDPSQFSGLSYSFLSASTQSVFKNAKPTIIIYEPKTTPSSFPFNVSFSVYDTESSEAYCAVFLYVNLVNQTNESVLYGSDLITTPTDGTITNYTVEDPTNGSITSINDVEILCVADYFAEEYQPSSGFTGGGGGGGGGRPPIPTEITVGEIPQGVHAYHIKLKLNPFVQHLAIYSQDGKFFGNYPVFSGTTLIMKEGSYQFVFWKEGYSPNIMNIVLSKDMEIESNLIKSEFTVTFHLVPSTQFVKMMKDGKIVRSSWVSDGEKMGVRAGEYTFEFSAEGYSKNNFDLSIYEDKNVTSILKPSGAGVSLGYALVGVLILAGLLSIYMYV